MTLFDSHCHLHDDRFHGDQENIILRAREAGVINMLCCGTRESDWHNVKTLCVKHKNLIPAFGLHPWYLNERSDNWLETLTNLLVQTPVAIVGEIGLDHAITDRNDDVQSRVFMAQLSLARRLNRPASIHCRKAWESLLVCLKQGAKSDFKFVIHSYSGSKELIGPLSELGAYFSFSGSITFHRNKRVHAACAAVPIERLLIETDSPDIMPVIDPPQQEHATVPNEPANLIHIARKVSKIKQISIESLTDITSENAKRLLNMEQ